MRKESAKKLGGFMWLYYIGAILSIGLAILIIANENSDFVSKGVDEFVKAYGVEMPAGVAPATIVGFTIIILALISFIEGWLFGRVIKDGSKSTLLIVLLTLSYLHTSHCI